MLIALGSAAGALAWVACGVAAFRRGRQRAVPIGAWEFPTKVASYGRCIKYALLGPFGWFRAGREKDVLEHWLAEA